MSKQGKLLDRLLSVPKDFTWDELTTLLGSYGYELINSKRGGSRRKFLCRETGLLINLHEPHPSKILKQYAIRDAIESLEQAGIIKR